MSLRKGVTEMARENAISISIKDSNIAPGVKILEKGEYEKNEEKKLLIQKLEIIK